VKYALPLGWLLFLPATRNLTARVLMVVVRNVDWNRLLWWICSSAQWSRGATMQMGS
jgi:hypothetical protein